MKNWLCQRFLPMWAKETVLRENRQLQQENARLTAKLREKEAYIRGIHKGLRKRNAECIMQNAE